MCFVFFFSTSGSVIEDLECEREVEGVGEGVLLLEWHEDVDLLAIHSQAHFLAPNMLKAQKNRVYNKGDNHLVQTLKQLLFHLE